MTTTLLILAAVEGAAECTMILLGAARETATVMHPQKVQHLEEQMTTLTRCSLLDLLRCVCGGPLWQLVIAVRR